MGRASKLPSKIREAEKLRPAKELHRPEVEVPHREGADQHYLYKSFRTLTLVMPPQDAKWRGPPVGR